MTVYVCDFCESGVEASGWYGWYDGWDAAICKECHVAHEALLEESRQRYQQELAEQAHEAELRSAGIEL
jgi:hypothetical protein